MKAYNPTKRLLQFLVLNVGIVVAMHVFRAVLDNFDIDILVISQFRAIAFWISFLVSTVIVLEIIGLFVITLLEIVSRVAGDSLLNTLKSIAATFKLRRFLIQNPREQTSLAVPERQIPNVDKSVSQYNRAIKKSVVDISNQEINVSIRIPKQHQAQKFLNEVLPDIREHISNLYPEYVISSFDRNKYIYWLKGTKR